MNSLKKACAVVVMMLLMVSGGRAVADVNSAPVQSPQVEPAPTLKLTVVISRMNGEKKIGNLPFVLMVVPNMATDGRPGSPTSLQTGGEIPVPTNAVSTKDGLAPSGVPSYQYRSFGTNIMAWGRNIGGGQFGIQLTVNDSQLMSDVPEAGSGRLPRFQSFQSNNQLLLRDGQTVQFLAATEKMSGDTIRLDVSMTVVK